MGVLFSDKKGVDVESAKIFDPNSDKYKCCCGHLRITTGAKLAAFVYVFGVSVHLLTASINFSKLGGLYSVLFAKALVNFICCIAAVGFLIYAFRKQRRVFVLPLMIYQLVFAVILLVIISLLIKGLARSGKALWELSHLIGQSATVPSANDHELRDQRIVTIVLAVVLLLVCVFALLMNLRYFLVIFSCFKYFRDKDNYNRYVAEGGEKYVPPKSAEAASGGTAIAMVDSPNTGNEKHESVFV